MSDDARPLWSDLTAEQQDEELLEALTSGTSIFTLVKSYRGLKYRDLTRRAGSAAFAAKAAPALEDAVATARVSSAFLAAAMLTNGTAVKDGLAYKELKLLLDRQKDIQGDAQAAPQNDDEKTAQALEVVRQQRWKLQNPQTAEA